MYKIESSSVSLSAVQRMTTSSISLKLFVKHLNCYHHLSIEILQCFYLKSTDNWQWEATPYRKLEFGKWELTLPANPDGSSPIAHLSEVKVIVRNDKGQLVERLSPWATYVVMPTDLSYGTNYKQKIWNPPESSRYKFQHRKPANPRSLRIYECHVGIATEKLEIGTYKNFADNVIPRIARQGYNAIQIMAILERKLILTPFLSF